jgi:hypothetical protein
VEAKASEIQARWGVRASSTLIKTPRRARCSRAWL